MVDDVDALGQTDGGAALWYLDGAEEYATGSVDVDFRWSGGCDGEVVAAREGVAGVGNQGVDAGGE